MKLLYGLTEAQMWKVHQEVEKACFADDVDNLLDNLTERPQLTEAQLDLLAEQVKDVVYTHDGLNQMIDGIEWFAIHDFLEELGEG